MSERAMGSGPADIEIDARVLALVTSIVGPRAIERETPWRSLGMDSLDLLTLVTSIEEAFDLRIDDQAAMRLRTVADVVDLVLSASR